MLETDLQSRCELGQELLMQMRYPQAEAILAHAEQDAWNSRDFDTLSRLYLPLQEARRQRRQRCSEGIVCLDLIAQDPSDILDGRHVVENFPQGQLLVAGWGSIAPALKVRQLQAEHHLNVETFLAAAYPIHGSRAIAIVPTPDVNLPPVDIASIDQLLRQLPPHSIVLPEHELPTGSQRGNSQTQAMVMSMWERLHAPFLAAADQEADPFRRIEAYRRTIRVDYACELAHQKTADLARQLAQSQRGR